MISNGNKKEKSSRIICLEYDKVDNQRLVKELSHNLELNSDIDTIIITGDFGAWITFLEFHDTFNSLDSKIKVQLKVIHTGDTDIDFEEIESHVSPYVWENIHTLKLFSQFRTLILQPGLDVSAADMKEAAQFPTVRNIHIVGRFTEETDLSPLLFLDAIDSLNIEHTGRHTLDLRLLEDIETLGHMKLWSWFDSRVQLPKNMRVKKLEIHIDNIINDDLSPISVWSKLEEITVFGIIGEARWETTSRDSQRQKLLKEVRDKVVDLSFLNSSKLKVLKIYARITCDAPIILPELREVVEIDINYTFIKKIDLVRLKDSRALRRLLVTYNQIPYWNFKPLSDLTNLEVLDISGNPQSHVLDMSPLKECKNLVIRMSHMPQRWRGQVYRELVNQLPFINDIQYGFRVRHTTEYEFKETY